VHRQGAELEQQIGVEQVSIASNGSGGERLELGLFWRLRERLHEGKKESQNHSRWPRKEEQRARNLHAKLPASGIGL
jgi:hypothetical protein